MEPKTEQQTTMNSQLYSRMILQLLPPGAAAANAAVTPLCVHDHANWTGPFGPAW